MSKSSARSWMPSCMPMTVKLHQQNLCPTRAGVQFALAAVVPLRKFASHARSTAASCRTSRHDTGHRASSTGTLPQDAAIALAASACALSVILLTSGTVRPAWAQEGDGFPRGSIPGCPASTSCVSTSALNAPRSFMPPWVFDPITQEQAFRQLLAELGRLDATIIEADEQLGLIVARINYGGTGEDADEVQFLFKEGRMVLFRSQSQKSLPDPPFCLRPGCINGPRNRDRMARIRDALGWSNMETDEDKQWQQIMLH